MNVPQPIVIDFETFPIGQRPKYPPEPTGVAIKWPRQPGRYYAWGHPVNNNCSREMGVMALAAAYESGEPLLFHHAKFDLAVLEERLDAPPLPWDRVHDTMFLAYLQDPHASSLGLKELAAAILNWPPDERDELAEWIGDHTRTLLTTYPWNREWDKKEQRYKEPNRISPKKAGAWIFATPGDLCGKYAIGDVDRTAGIFEYLWPRIQEQGMGEAYDRERRLLLILMENERVGLRVDLARLQRDIETYQGAFDRTEEALRYRLNASGLNFDADADVADVLLKTGIVPQDKWTLTAEGQLSVSKDNLRPDMFTDPLVASALGYRNRLKTCLEMFMKPWEYQAAQRRGYMSTNWNQTRGAEKGGTRSGRPSTENPNLLNLSKSWEGRDDGYTHPAFLSVPVLPLVRIYILPDEGGVFLHRDFDGQELRIFAEGSQGYLRAQYLANPALDPHKYVGDEFMRVAQREFERTKVKTLNFQGIYGGGIPALQAKLRCSAAEAKELKHFHDKALPDRLIFNDEIKRIVRRGEPIRTLGGRLYYPEAPSFDKKRQRVMTWEYKLINYWVQGSAADLTKESIIVWHGAKVTARFLVTVYDEINVTSPFEDRLREMRILRESMEASRFGMGVPMLSSPKHGPSWGECVKGEPS